MHLSPVTTDKYEPRDGKFVCWNCNKIFGHQSRVKCCETLQKVQHRRGKNKAFVPYATFDYKSKLDKHMLYTGDKLMKIFIGAKIL